MNRHFLNQLTNVIWTLLFFAAVVVYWVNAYAITWILAFLLVSISIGILPDRIFQRFQLSHSPAFYEHLGARTIRKFVQDGDLINRAIRKKSSGYAVINRQKVGTYRQQVAMYERYHVVCLAFFFLTSLHALANQEILYLLLISLSNLFYNVAPIILQQYNRARILKILK